MENIAINPSEKRDPVNLQKAGLVLILLILFALVGWMIASQVVSQQDQNQQELAIATFEEQTGIRVLRVAVTSGGGMLDFMYQVIDPDKAPIIHDDETPPALISEATNQLVATPFHDHAFREMHTAVTYHEIIMNGGGLLERGDKVTLILGGSKLEHLEVQ